ncbi:hypothetical protein ACEPAF_3295 [Sanghuangporus sanghuang]
MSLSPLKRSASDAHLENHQRPRKSARKNMPRTDSRRAKEKKVAVRDEPGLAAKWKEMGRLGVGTLRAFGSAISATFATVASPLRRAIFPFPDFDGLILPTHRLIGDRSLSSLPVPSQQESRTNSSSTLKPPQKQTNNSPTNILASSSTSAPSFYPTPQSSQASSTTSTTSTAIPSSSDGLETSSTQTSVPNTPPSSQTAFASQSDSIRNLINQKNRDGILNGGVVKSYRRKRHIYEGQHREHVKDYLQRVLYERTRALGYQSDYETFKGYMKFRQRLEEIQKTEHVHSRANSVAPTPILPQDDAEYFKRAVEKATKSLQSHSPKPPRPFNPALEGLTLRTRSKNEHIKDRLHPKRKPIPERLPSDAEREVNALLRKRGVVSKAGREQVSDADLARLMPGQWLNDEIINFYGQLIVDRAAEAEAAKENEKGKLWNVHYFSTFFWPKLQSGYEKGRLAKWTKKVDIFSKDIVIMAVNHGNAHWTSAAIDFRRKRIISHDSMGFERGYVYKALRTYLNEEHKNKKKKPFDFGGWEDFSSKTYPEQENGYDCGVFTCQTLEYLSRGEEEFNFTQRNMPYLRQRMIWEIGKAELGDPL